MPDSSGEIQKKMLLSRVVVVDSDYWEILKKEIHDLLKFNTSHYRDNFLMRRVEVRLRALGMNSYEEYSKKLLADFDERKKLQNELTIHVTHFFRDKTLYDELQDWIIPQLIKEKTEKNDFKIAVWSAGCSTGEEPYSIAMLFHEILGSNINDFQIMIKATDIDLKTVQKARLGRFEENSFVEVSPNIKKKYFTKVEDEYHINEDVKKIVLFNQGNILDSDSRRSFDFIFCRNTVIYFSKDTKIDLYENFYSKLKNGGFLVLGKTEFLDGTARAKFEVYNNSERIFRKPVNAVSSKEVIDSFESQ